MTRKSSKETRVPARITDEEPLQNQGETGSAQAKTPSEQSVQFINAEVLAPPTEDPVSFAKPYADQVAAMMLEDARAFMQGTEQVLLIAISRSLEQIIETDGAEGEKALNACEKLMKDLPTFGADVATTAGKIIGEF